MLPRSLRIVARKLARSPSFSLLVVLTLAVGFGTNTAIFSVVDSVLLDALPYPESDRIVWVNFTAPGLGHEELPFSDGVFLRAREQQRTMEEMALFAGGEINLSGEGSPVRLSAARVTPGFFRVLGVEPTRGRAFATTDGEAGAAPVAVLSHGLWTSRFGQDPDVVGRTVTLDGVSHRVVGVAPAGLDYPDPDVQVWIPLTIDPANLHPSSFAYPCIARLEAGETPEAAEADLGRLTADIGEIVPDLTPAVVEKAGFAPVVQPLKERLVGDVRLSLWILLAAGFLVLLIAFVNVLNLSLVRAEERGRELALRSAFGAEPADLALLTVGEVVVLALVAGAVGLVPASIGLDGLLSVTSSAVPRAHHIGLNDDVLWFTAAVVLGTGLVLGALLVSRLRSSDLWTTLRESGRTATASRSRVRGRRALVVLQIVLALVLLIGAGLMTRTYRAVRSVDPGFRAASVLTSEIALPAADYPTAERAASFWSELARRVSAQAGVESAAVASSVPLGARLERGDYQIEGREIAEDELMALADRKYVTAGYFETLGIPLFEGRTFEPEDGVDGFRAVVVNRSFAERWWPDSSPIGQRIRLRSSHPWYEIVGVVGDVRLRSLEREPDDVLYFPVLHGSAEAPRSGRHMSLAARAEDDPAALAGTIREQVRALDPNLPVARTRTLGSLVERSTTRTSFMLMVLGIGAAVALLLAAVGVYGVISYSVGQRRREIGVRMAMGATGGSILRRVVGQGAVLGVAGVVLGVAASMGLSRLLQSLLYEVGPGDPVTYVGAAAGLLGIAVVASYVPARRAAACDPVEVLRHE